MQNLIINEKESRIISIIRSFAMLCIIVCHLLGWFPKISFFSQLFNVGVPIFFIISGYLYGHKKIKNILPWYKKQFFKIVIPIYIYILICALVLLCLGKIGSIDPLKSVFVLFQLTGFIKSRIGNIITAHLWFISYILFCYLITPMIGHLSKNITIKKASVIITCLALIEIFAMLILRLSVIAWIPGVLSYVLAFFIGALWNKKMSKKRYILLTIAMIVSIIMRLLVKNLADSKIIDCLIYDGIISVYTHCVLAYWLFYSLYLFFSKYDNLLKNLYPICKICDYYSYEVYICHYMFLVGVLSFKELTPYIGANVFCFILITVFYAVIIKQISSFLIKKR